MCSLNGAAALDRCRRALAEQDDDRELVGER
jgi:hypothetical protein